MINKFWLTGVMFLLTGATGLWLGKLGKPYGTLVFTIHKLVALAFVIITALVLSNSIKTTNPKTLLIVTSVVLAVSVIALFATGALMSVGKLPFETVNAVHKVVALLVLIGIAIITYFKINN